jgi:hypothetical protein
VSHAILFTAVHTASDVMVFASGPGSDFFGRSIDNTEVFFGMAAAVDVANDAANNVERERTAPETGGEVKKSSTGSADFAESTVGASNECSTQLATQVFHSTALWFVCLCLVAYSIGITCFVMQLRRKEGAGQSFQAVGARSSSTSPRPRTRGAATSASTMQDLEPLPVDRQMGAFQDGGDGGNRQTAVC